MTDDTKISQPTMVSDDLLKIAKTVALVLLLYLIYFLYECAFHYVLVETAMMENFDQNKADDAEVFGRVAAGIGMMLSILAPSLVEKGYLRISRIVIAICLSITVVFGQKWFIEYCIEKAPDSVLTDAYKLSILKYQLLHEGLKVEGITKSESSTSKVKFVPVENTDIMGYHSAKIHTILYMPLVLASVKSRFRFDEGANKAIEVQAKRAHNQLFTDKIVPKLEENRREMDKLWNDYSEVFIQYHSKINRPLAEICWEAIEPDVEKFLRSFYLKNPNLTYTLTVDKGVIKNDLYEAAGLDKPTYFSEKSYAYKAYQSSGNKVNCIEIGQKYKKEAKNKLVDDYNKKMTELKLVGLPMGIRKKSEFYYSSVVQTRLKDSMGDDWVEGFNLYADNNTTKQLYQPEFVEKFKTEIYNKLTLNDDKNTEELKRSMRGLLVPAIGLGISIMVSIFSIFKIISLVSKKIMPNLPAIGIIKAIVFVVVLISIPSYSSYFFGEGATDPLATLNTENTNQIREHYRVNVENKFNWLVAIIYYVAIIYIFISSCISYIDASSLRIKLKAVSSLSFACALLFYLPLEPMYFLGVETTNSFEYFYNWLLWMQPYTYHIGEFGCHSLYIDNVSSMFTPLVKGIDSLLNL